MKYIHSIVGPMFSGKTEKLEYYLKREKYAGNNVLLYRPTLDTRETRMMEGAFQEKRVNEFIDITYELEYIKIRNITVIAIDEIQFLRNWTYNFVTELINFLPNNYDIKIYLSGLDMDTESVPFEGVGNLLCISNKVEKLTGVCMFCGSKEGNLTYSITKNNGFRVGDKEDGYKVCCQKCFEVNE
jgi:thymidine kinase